MSDTTRAEERAEEELDLKRQALQLERDKFRFDKVLKYRDRLVSSIQRMANAIVIANASALVFSLTYHKQLADLAGKSYIGYSTALFLAGLLFAVVAFLDVSMMSYGDIELTHEAAIASSRAFKWFAIHAGVASLLLFAGVSLPVSEIWVQPEWLQNLAKTNGTRP